MSTPARKPATAQERARILLTLLQESGSGIYNSPDDIEAALIELQRQAVEPILRAAASEIRPCRACGAELFFVLHRNTGKAAPYTAEGVNHFINCPRAKEFKR